MPCYDMIEFDLRLGTPGLHDVGRKVEARERKTILPPDLFLRYQNDAFWEDLPLIPPSVHILPRYNVLHSKWRQLDALPRKVHA